ncbi:hypothetical protein [Streptomyces sp. ICBB 8177]|uniref:hypothetical protein n=1 Tax=Streptomyces sp. ICBB 8177 TaxID=563922 RepID=UPI000D676331|nr:hypothetical protein [Streptomyces sp. ICBB 8177]PWI45840.1 hypothetical protein CK485_01380 [Streptomyces sp. ICBB 8177]
MGDKPEADAPLMILMRDADGRVVYEVWHTTPAPGQSTADPHVEAALRSKAEARRIAREAGFYLVEEGEIWDHLPDE